MMNDTERNLLTLIEFDERIMDLRHEMIATMMLGLIPGAEKKCEKKIEQIAKKCEQLIRARGGIKIRLKKTGVKRK